MGIKDAFIKFTIRKNLEKGAKGVGTAAAGQLASLAVKHAGIDLTSEQQAALGIALSGAIVSLANLLKTKYPASFGWL